MRIYQFIPEPLPIDRDKSLRAWLAKPEMALLRLVLAAQCSIKEQEAIEHAHGAVRNTGSYALLAEDSMKEAARLRTCMDVLEELSNAESQLFTLKLK